jgi:hypothetical protein
VRTLVFINLRRPQRAAFFYLLRTACGIDASLGCGPRPGQLEINSKDSGVTTLHVTPKPNAFQEFVITLFLAVITNVGFFADLPALRQKNR